MLPCEIVRLRVPGSDGPQMTSALRCFAALAKVRIYRQVVAHRVLPPIIVGLVVWKSIPANETRA